MSLRPPVDQSRIEALLIALGRRFQGRGRLYLVGGTTAVMAGLRSHTLDVDITYHVDDADHASFTETVRSLKDELQINIEEVSPADFIPLPAGSEDRARFIGRYGNLDVFHFDPYSTALSKIERGREEDFEDVVGLLHEGWLEWAQLDAYFEEILPRVTRESLRSDPEDFARKFDILRALWQQQET